MPTTYAHWRFGCDCIETLPQDLQAKGMKTLAIVNVVGSSIAREADHVFYTKAGPEIAVATTKAYSAQLIAMYLLAVQVGLVKGKIQEAEPFLKEMETLPEKWNACWRKRIDFSGLQASWEIRKMPFSLDAGWIMRFVLRAA